MELTDQKLLGEEVQTILRDRVETECFMCLGEYDSEDYAPVVMCTNMHTCCGPCLKEVLKQDLSKAYCPYCNAPAIRKTMTKNRYLMTIFELVEAFKRHVKELHQEAETSKRHVSFDTKASLLSKNPKLVSSLIFAQEGNCNNKMLGDSLLFDELPIPTSRSHTWVGVPEKRRNAVLAYA